MRANRIGMEALTTAARAAGFVMLPVEDEGEAATPALLALPAPSPSYVGHMRAETGTEVETARTQIANSASSVTSWIRERLPTMGRGAPA